MRQQVMDTDVDSEAPQVLPYRAPNFVGRNSKQLAKSTLHRFNIAGSPRRCFTAVAERMISLGQEPFCGNYTQSRPFPYLRCIDGEVRAEGYGATRLFLGSLPPVEYHTLWSMFLYRFEHLPSGTEAVDRGYARRIDQDAHNLLKHFELSCNRDPCTSIETNFPHDGS